MKKSGDVKAIVFTGGGSGGHVIPNLPLIERLTSEGWHVSYIGCPGSFEENVISRVGIHFHKIPAGKLRRYFSLKNFSDPFLVLAGIFRSWLILRRLRPSVVFSKGGFVGFPVVLSAWLSRIPSIVHESDLTPGLTTRICSLFATRVCVGFDETRKKLPFPRKVLVTGNIVRPEFFSADKHDLSKFGFSGSRPTILVVGGSQGSSDLNAIVREALPLLTNEFDIIHLCGSGKIDRSLRHKNYVQLEYLDAEYPNVLRAADLAVSRAGAGALFELIACEKPHLLIPLPRAASRGDQHENAELFESKGLSMVLRQEQLTPGLLASSLRELWNDKERYRRNLESFRSHSLKNPADVVLGEIYAHARRTCGG